jgi:hypothetical protein
MIALYACLGLHETQLGPIVLMFGSYGRVSRTGQTASHIHLGHRVSPQSSRVTSMSLLSIGESSGFAYGGLITPGCTQLHVQLIHSREKGKAR